MTRSDARKRLAQCADIRASSEYADIRTLPAPDCPSGYTTSQLDQIIGNQMMPAFRRWMVGRPQAFCHGTYYETAECTDQPHGIVTYPCDVQRFLTTLPPLRVAHQPEESKP